QVPGGSRRWLQAVFGVDVGARPPAAHSGPRGGAATVKVQTTAPFLPKEVYTDATPVQVCRISRLGSRRAAIGGYVERDPSRGRARYFGNAVNSCTPNVHEAPGRHGL